MGRDFARDFLHTEERGRKTDFRLSKADMGEGREGRRKFFHAEGAEFFHAEFAEYAEDLSHAEGAEELRWRYFRHRKGHAEGVFLAHAEFAEYAEFSSHAEFAEYAEEFISRGVRGVRGVFISRGVRGVFISRGVRGVRGGFISRGVRGVRGGGMLGGEPPFSGPTGLAPENARADRVIAAKRRTMTHRPARSRASRSDKFWSHPRQSDDLSRCRACDSIGSAATTAGGTIA